MKPAKHTSKSQSSAELSSAEQPSAEQAQRQAEHAGLPRVRSSELVLRAVQCLNLSDWTGACETSQEALRLMEAEGIRTREEHLEQARCCDVLGQALAALGYWHESRMALERAAAAWETLECGRELAASLQNLGQLHKNSGHVDAAMDYTRQAAHCWEREGWMTEAGLTWLELATCLADVGETRAATRHLKQGLHRVDTAGNAEARMNARKIAAAVYALLGDSEAKLEQLEALCGLQEAWIRERKAEKVNLETAHQATGSTPPAASSEDAAYLEAIRTFTGKAAHDMKEPLRMIGSFSALLRRQYGALLDEEGNEFLDIVQDAGERMNELLAKLLEYTRLGTSGKAFQPLDLTDAVTLAVHRLRGPLDQRDARVETQALPQINGLRDELELLVVQLLDNALKFNRSKRPHMVISAVEESDSITLKVQDNGIGIPAANRSEVFDLFRRLHPRSEFRGSGIGLTMVARIAALHGGDSWVENSRLGGCCVCVRLPK